MNWDEATLKAYLPQIVVLIGIGLTFLVGLVNVFLTIHRGKREGITQNRMAWINSVRSTTASIVGYDYRTLQTQEQLEIANSELLKNAYVLNLFLNIQGKYDSVILKYLNGLVSSRKRDFSDDPEEDTFIRNRRLLNLSMQIYLKAEWDRVKTENKMLRLPYSETRKLEKILKKFSASNSYVNEIRNDFLIFKKEKDCNPHFFTEFISIQAHTNIASYSNILCSESSDASDPPQRNVGGLGV